MRLSNDARLDARVEMLKMMRDKMAELDEALRDCADDAAAEVLDLGMLDPEIADAAKKYDAYRDFTDTLIAEAKRQFHAAELESVWVGITPRLHAGLLDFEVEIFSDRPKFDDPDFVDNFPTDFQAYQGNIDGGDSTRDYGNWEY